MEELLVHVSSASSQQKWVSLPEILLENQTVPSALATDISLSSAPMQDLLRLTRSEHLIDI